MKLTTVSMEALCSVDDNVQIVGSICDNCDQLSNPSFDEWHTDAIPRSKYWPKENRGHIAHVCNAGPTLLIMEGDPVHAYCDKKLEHILAGTKGK